MTTYDPPRTVQKLGATSRNRLVANGTQYRHLIMSRTHSWTMNAFVMRRSGLYMAMHATTVRFSKKPIAATMYRYRASLMVSICPRPVLAAPSIVLSSIWCATSTTVDVVVSIAVVCFDRLDVTFYSTIWSMMTNITRLFLSHKSRDFRLSQRKFPVRWHSYSPVVPLQFLCIINRLTLNRSRDIRHEMSVWGQWRANGCAVLSLRPRTTRIPVPWSMVVSGWCVLQRLLLQFQEGNICNRDARVRRMYVVRYVITLAPGVGYEGNAFGSVCLSVCLLLRLTWFFYTRSIIPMARFTVKMIRFGIRICTQEFILGFFAIERHGKICHQSMPQHQTCVVMKICIITSHSERWSVISDCLVVIAKQFTCTWVTWQIHF